MNPVIYVYSDTIKLVSEHDELTPILKQKKICTFKSPIYSILRYFTRDLALTTNYHRQRETIITWLDEETQQDLAISFQELQGANDTWKAIWAIQGKDPDQISADDDSDDEWLPVPSLDSLSRLQNTIELIDMSRRSKFIEKMLWNDGKFFKLLFECFHTAEESNDAQKLKEIFSIMKDILNLADTHLLEVLMSDKYYMDVFGILEHNSELQNQMYETKHRECKFRFS